MVNNQSHATPALPRESFQYPWIGSWVGPTAGVHQETKSVKSVGKGWACCPNPSSSRLALRSAQPLQRADDPATECSVKVQIAYGCPVRTYGAAMYGQQSDDQPEWKVPFLPWHHRQLLEQTWKQATLAPPTSTAIQHLQMHLVFQATKDTTQI